MTERIEINLYNGVKLVIKMPDEQQANFMKLKRYLFKIHFLSKLKYIKCQTYNLRNAKDGNDNAQSDQIKEFSIQLKEYKTWEILKYFENVQLEYEDWEANALSKNTENFYEVNNCFLFKEYYSYFLELRGGLPQTHSLSTSTALNIPVLASQVKNKTRVLLMAKKVKEHHKGLGFVICVEI
jgi:hypothetical protein